MNAKPVSSIEKLLRASSDDERTLEFPLPDSGFGFHAQQAVKKLYKCLLFARQGTFPFSHDLHALRLRVEAQGLALPSSSFRLEELSEYAANARYDDPILLTSRRGRPCESASRIFGASC